jgi:hypothetical protein
VGGSVVRSVADEVGGKELGLALMLLLSSTQEEGSASVAAVGKGV